MGQNAIEIEGLHFGYKKQEVLCGVDLQVPQGAIFGFLGRNGAGKTTMIKLLLGLPKPESGVCTIEDIDPQRDEIAVRKSVGYMDS